MNSNSHGARPVHQIISMIKWIRTSRLSIHNTHTHSLSLWEACRGLVTHAGAFEPEPKVNILIFCDFFAISANKKGSKNGLTATRTVLGQH